MEAILRDLVDEAQRSGARRYTQWDDRRFAEWCEGPVSRVDTALSRAASSSAWPGAERRARLRDYLVLIQEGLGRGYLVNAGGAARSFAEALLRDLLPGWLIAAPAGLHAPLLAKTWNVAEGVAREVPWLNQYLLARLDQITDPERFPDEIAQLLAPVLQPLAPVDWTGVSRIHVLDPRPVDDEFLPGPMSWIAPRLLRVHDRRRAVCLGVLLTSGDPALVGTVCDAQPYEPPPAAPPTLQWAAGGFTVAGQRMDLPFFDEPVCSVISAGGFIIAATVSSHRLWVVQYH